MDSRPPRRDVVIRLSRLAAALAAGGSLLACGGGGGEGLSTGTGGTAEPPAGGSGPQPDFLYGVSSGDPLADRVVLWTHARYPDSTAPVELRYEVATDSSFTTIVSSGAVTATAGNGHTAKVDATGLAAGTGYVYRFTHGNTRSPVGRTRTLPGPDATRVTLAVMSCANYPAGYFHVYAEAARSDADVAVHLGDVIYEYEADGYASGSAAALGRVSVPAHELRTLDDYRQRHAQYRRDPDAMTLHARMPMIAVWDDHEVANDAWRDGAANHDPATEGSWAARKAAAQQAYHEWMPIRTGADRARIYRSFDFGRLLSLHMLDTRHIGRDEPVSLNDLAGLAGAQRQTQAQAVTASPGRQLLGAEQMQWLQGQLAASTATWQVLGQQVVMARMLFPLSVLSALSAPDAATAGYRALVDYLGAKGTPAAQRTVQQQALLDPARNPLVGYNPDAWDGYPAAREAVLAAAHRLQRRLVVLAGDSHNAWCSTLRLDGSSDPALAGIAVGDEWATASVTSPGLESALTTLTPAQVQAVFQGVVDDLRWMDASRRGYLKASFTATEARADWIFVDSVTRTSATASIGYSTSRAA